MDAARMFLGQHGLTHARVERLLATTPEAAMRRRVIPGANPVAWHLWHVARAEDMGVNRLVADRPQVLDDGHLARLGVMTRGGGTGMTDGECDAVAARVDVAAVGAYWAAVGARTAEVVAGLDPADLDEVVGPEQLRRLLVGEEAVAPDAALPLLEHWTGRTRGYYLLYLGLIHTYEHIGHVDLLRGLLGLRGRF
jgi:hypothetical protein